MTSLVMMRDVEARFALQGRPVRYTVLRPYGNWFGRGALRVLRVQERVSPHSGELVDVVLGYDRYDTSA